MEERNHDHDYNEGKGAGRVKRTLLRQVISGVLLVFVLVNLLFYTSAKWNADHMPGVAKWRFLSVLTGSMEPTLQAGDLIVVERYGTTEPRPGEIVTFWEDQAHQSVITHRIVQRLHNGYLQTKGDANVVKDGGWTAPDRVVGRMVAVIPHLASIYHFLQKPAVLLSMIAGLIASGIYSKRRLKQTKMGELT
ncbi:signal peptidase I [Brevibacillus fluminis]|uniref:Signal peptidase I n=1 Tax=Brevibacillus fluminis TaxID=511487 RepID=A0A3M8DI32_9BACL|nr:signal peptidase I [Brevibacillus fluminis]